MAKIIFCVKTQQEAEGLDRPPYPGALGKRIFEQVSAQAWRGWLEHQKMLVNEYRLNLADSRARKYLMEQTERYFLARARMWLPVMCRPMPKKRARIKTASNEQSGFALARRNCFLRHSRKRTLTHIGRRD